MKKLIFTSLTLLSLSTLSMAQQKKEAPKADATQPKVSAETKFKTAQERRSAKSKTTAAANTKATSAQRADIDPRATAAKAKKKQNSPLNTRHQPIFITKKTQYAF